MARSRKHEIGVGLLLIAALALLGYMSLKVGALKGMGDAVRVRAVMDDAAGLTKGAAIKVAGVEVGTVNKLSVDHDQAIIGLQLQEDAGIRTDAVVQVRARSVLGEKFLEIIPQSRDAPLLQDGDVIEHTRGQTEIDQLVNDLGPVVGAMDAQKLSEVVDTVHAAVAGDPQRVERMMADLETILDNGAEVSKELPAVVGETRGTLAELRQVARDARPIIQRADGIVTRLDEATQDLPATADDLEGLISETRAAVTEGREVLGALEGSTAQLTQILDNLSEIDKWELRRLLREEGILVRLRRSEVVESEE